MGSENGAGKILYIRADQNTEVKEPCVSVGDIASVFCADEHIMAKVKALTVFRFHKEAPKRQVISILKVIELITKEYPGIQVENLGETAVLLEWIDVEKHKGPVQWLKLTFVSMITFFGTSFTIMAFHNDIGIYELFDKLHTVVAGTPAKGINILEISYSIGLAIGIIVFFNHIGGRRITKDPTPIEVEMRIYETDVNTALIETSDRQGDTIDVYFLDACSACGMWSKLWDPFICRSIYSACLSRTGTAVCRKNACGKAYIRFGGGCGFRNGRRGMFQCVL